MKKTYQTPVVLPTDFDLQQLLTSSLQTDDVTGNPYQDLSDAPTTTETSGNLSRRRSVWEDEELNEEEEF